LKVFSTLTVGLAVKGKTGKTLNIMLSGRENLLLSPNTMQSSSEIFFKTLKASLAFN